MKTLVALLAATVLGAGCVVPVDGGYSNAGYPTAYPSHDAGYGNHPGHPGSYGGHVGYGRIEFGNTPPPVYYSQPVIITQPRYVQQPPIYVNVPPEHRSDWRSNCGRYNACDRPVYFVRPVEGRDGRRDDRNERDHHRPPEGPRAGWGHPEPAHRGVPRAEPDRGRGERIDFGPREPREARDGRERRDGREARDGRDGREGRDGRDGRREPDERRRHHEPRAQRGDAATR